MSVVRSLGAFVAEAGQATMGDATLHHARRALLDWTGATLAGWRTEPVEILAAVLADEVGQGNAQVLGRDDGRAPARTAALLNGTASHAGELDDIYAPGLYHPGSPTIAAALAAAQAANASSATLLKAIVIGYQVGNTIARAVQPTHYRYWHTTGTVGCFGAAAAASVALGLTARQSAHALATSATFAAGLQQAFRSDSMSKPLHAGRAAEAGVFAALCAARGLTGETAMLEGPEGFGRAMSDRVDWDAMLRNLHEPWTVGESTHKIHACCGHNFAAIDGALVLRDAIGGTGIASIRVETYSTAVQVAGIREPVTPFEAKFSLPFTVATALIHGHVQSGVFSEQHLLHRGVRDLMGRIELVATDEFDQEYPALRGAATTIVLDDGRTLRHHQPTRRGAPAYPLTDEELELKFLHLVQPILGEKRSAALLQQLARMDRAADCWLDLHGSRVERTTLALGTIA
jgi:2-methylcitrate dehydratase PrpD